MDSISSKLYAAICAAQADIKHPKLDKSSTAFSGRSYAYASLASVIDALRPALARHGLAILQPVSSDGSDLVVKTIVMHSSGEAIESEQRVENAPTKPQERGSLTTYLRRYGLQSMLCVAAEEDDDGTAAQSAATIAEPREGIVVRSETVQAVRAVLAAPKPQKANPAAKKPSGMVRVSGVVERIFMNEKVPHKVVLEDGTQLKAWTEVEDQLHLLQQGGAYDFEVIVKEDAKYGKQFSIRDWNEISTATGEEIPF